MEASGPEKDAIKQAATIAVDRFNVADQHINEQIIKTSGWLGASLLAINGGGAIASMNAADHLASPAICAGFFVSGLIFALLNAAAIQEILLRTQEPFQNWVNYWRGIALTGERDEPQENELIRKMKAINRWRWLPPAFGWLSGIVFFLGVVVVSYSLRLAQPIDRTACEALKADILSTKPKHADAATGYEALGCRSPR